MAARPAARRIVASSPEWLLLVATGALVLFHYATRADAVGVRADGRPWVALTGPPLQPTVHFVMSGLLLGVLPVLAARLTGGLRPADLGLGLGRWRLGLAWLAAGLPLAALAGWIGAGSPGMR
ncbi:MAG: hypothetical protein L0Y54_19195, partial [Sporichthyaceae bacterium]|nr:hypothetical protein [Sporichthyaceae bacterium]